MGHIYEDHGKIAIEGRRESFIIHAGYGYEPGIFRLGDIASLGLEFVAKRQGTDQDRIWKVSLIAEDRIEARESQFSVIQTFRPDDSVKVPDRERESNHPLGSLWRDHPHPEIEISDLDDLIEALTDYKEAIS